MELWPDGLPRMATVYDDGAAHGDARVTHRTITEAEAQFARIRSFNPSTGGRGGNIVAGDTFAELRVGRALWMSDTPDERRDQRFVIHRAAGRVLVGGLGFGLTVLGLAVKPEVEAVTVVEINPDVIGLVKPALERALGDDAGKVEIVEADLFEWKPPPGATWDLAWFDVWANLCTDNLADMARLNRKFARRVSNRYSWGEAECRRHRRRGW